MVGATQHHGVGWGGDDNILCTCTHGWCYATSCSLHLHTWWCYATSCFLHLHTWSVLRNIMFLALAHMVGATQHHVLDQNSINLFRRLVGDEVCKERCDSYVLTAGDNCAESLCAVSKKTIETHQFEYCSGVRQDWAPLSFEFTLFKQSSRLGTHHASTAVPQNEMHVWLGVSHRAFKKPLWQLWLTCSKKKGWLSCC